MNYCLEQEDIVCACVSMCVRKVPHRYLTWALLPNNFIYFLIYTDSNPFAANLLYFTQLSYYFTYCMFN